MRKYVSCGLIILLCGCLTACTHRSDANSSADHNDAQSSLESQNSVSMEHLDFSDTNEIVPKNDSYYRMRFSMADFTTDAAQETMQKLYEAFFQTPYAEAEIKAIGLFSQETMGVNNPDEPLRIGGILPLKGVPSHEIEYITYLQAFGENDYLDFNRAGMFEAYSIADANRISGSEQRYQASWRPNFSGSLSKTIYPGENVKYQTPDGMMSFAEACAVAEDFYQREDLQGGIGSSMFTCEAVQGEVYAFPTDYYGYSIDSVILLDGVPICTKRGYSAQDQKQYLEYAQGYVNIVPVQEKCFVCKKDSVSWFWTSGLGSLQCTEQEEYAVQELVTREDAIATVAGLVTSGMQHKVTEVVLEYAFAEVYASNETPTHDTKPIHLQLEPTWRIVLGTPTSQYSSAIFHVSAVTGEVVVRYD